MPSIFTLQGPQLAQGPIVALQVPESLLIPQAKSTPSSVASTNWRKLAIFGGIGVGLATLIWLAIRPEKPKEKFLGSPQRIAKESKTAEEYARRVEAWSASEATPPSMSEMARAYRNASPAKMRRLIREAREHRLEARERLWSKMSRGLRAAIPDGVAKRRGCTARGVDAKQLKIGTEVELEHTTSRKLAREIALDHLCESPHYYRGANVKAEHLLLKRKEFQRLARKAA